jgi:hypothetical protein
VSTSRTILTNVFLRRTVPTKDQILVPETLLKKRKSQEKAREQRLSAIEKRKKVSHTYSPYIFGDDTYQQSDEAFGSMLSFF